MSETASLAQAISASLLQTRIPVPTPPVFAGDPLQFIDFERSFKLLIESRGLPASERLYYLKQYLQGPARDAVEGCFYSSTIEAYDEAWRTLRERFGHPFIIQQAFRARLDKWPKVGAKDATGLQKYADFLKSCHDATAYVPGLSVLNDCLENQKMVSKLPEWLVMRWNRQVTLCLESSGSFPLFVDFVKAVSREAKVLNNPITSMLALGLESHPKSGGHREAQKHGTSFATEAKSGEEQEKKEYPPCYLCEVSRVCCKDTGRTKGTGDEV